MDKNEKILVSLLKALVVYASDVISKCEKNNNIIGGILLDKENIDIKSIKDYIDKNKAEQEKLSILLDLFKKLIDESVELFDKSYAN